MNDTELRNATKAQLREEIIRLQGVERRLEAQLRSLAPCEGFSVSLPDRGGGALWSYPCPTKPYMEGFGHNLTDAVAACYPELPQHHYMGAPEFESVNRSFHCGPTRVFLTPRAFGLFVPRLLDIVGDACKQNFHLGFEEGANLIRRLASHEITVAQLEEQREKHAKLEPSTFYQNRAQNSLRKNR